MEEKTSVKRPRRKLLVVIGAILAVAVISGGGYLLYKNKISADTSSAPYSQSLCNLYLENDIQLPANNLRKGIYVFGASTTMTTLSDSDLIAAMDGGSTTVRDITDNTYLDNLVRYTTVVPSTGRNNIFIAYSGDNTKIIRSNAFTCQAGDKIYVNASLYNTGYINYSKISVAADMNSANPTSICLQKDSAYTLFSRDQSTTTGSPLYHSSDGSINGTETDLIGIGYSNTNDLTKCGATAAAATASGAISGTSTIANAPTAASVIAAAANGTGLPSQICIKKADGLFTLLNKGSSSDSYQSTDGTMQGKYEDFYTNPGLADLSSCGITKVTPVATGNSAGSPSTTSTTKTLANGTQITVIQQMCFDKPSTGEPVAMYKAKDGYNYDNAGNKYSDAELMQNGFTNSVALDKCGLTEAAVNDTTKNNLPATAAPATKALNIVSNKTTDFPYGTGEITFQPVRFSFGGSTTMDSWAPVGGVNFTVTIYPDSKKTSFLDIFNNVMAEKAYAAQADSKNTQTNTTALTNKNTNSVMAAAVQLPYDSNVLKPGDKTFAQKTTDVFKNMFSSQNSYQVSGIVPENGSNSSFTLTKMPAGTYEIVLNRSNFNSSQWSFNFSGGKLNLKGLPMAPSVGSEPPSIAVTPPNTAQKYYDVNNPNLIRIAATKGNFIYDPEYPWCGWMKGAAVEITNYSQCFIEPDYKTPGVPSFKTPQAGSYFGSPGGNADIGVAINQTGCAKLFNNGTQINASSGSNPILVGLGTALLSKGNGMENKDALMIGLASGIIAQAANSSDGALSIAIQAANCLPYLSQPAMSWMGNGYGAGQANILGNYLTGNNYMGNALGGLIFK